MEEENKRLKKTLVRIRFILFFIFVTFMLVFMSKVINFIFVNEIKAFQHTLTEQRETAGGIEQTAMTDRIIDMNKRITTNKVLANLPIIKHFYIQEFRDIDIIR